MLALGGGRSITAPRGRVSICKPFTIGTGTYPPEEASHTYPPTCGGLDLGTRVWRTVRSKRHSSERGNATIKAHLRQDEEDDRREIEREEKTTLCRPQFSWRAWPGLPFWPDAETDVYRRRTIFAPPNDRYHHGAPYYHNANDHLTSNAPRARGDTGHLFGGQQRSGHRLSGLKRCSGCHHPP